MDCVLLHALQLISIHQISVKAANLIVLIVLVHLIVSIAHKAPLIILTQKLMYHHV